MNAIDEDGNWPIDKKIVHIPLLSSFADGDDQLTGEITIPSSTSKPKALIIFAHGSGSGRDSPRNHYVADALNKNGFATLLSDLLTPEEQESDIKTQKIMGKYPGIVLNKFNIHLLSDRLSIITKWMAENVPEVNDLPIGFFGSSTGAAAAIEASVLYDLSDKIYAIVSRGGRPDLAYPDSIKNLKAATMLIVGSKDAKEVVELNKKELKKIKNARSKDLVIILNAGHLFDEEGAIEQVADVATKWFAKYS